MKRICAVALSLALSAPAAADEVEDALTMALEAYQVGDVTLAIEELDFAKTLLTQMKGQALQNYLPEAPSGWERRVSENSGGGAAGFMGGGMVAEALYTRDTKRVNVQIMANGQMVTTMATMFGNSTMMSSMGKVKRHGRQKYVVTHDGEIQALIDGRILVQIDGSAPVADKEALFFEMDFAGLKAF